MIEEIEKSNNDAYSEYYKLKQRLCLTDAELENMKKSKHSQVNDMRAAVQKIMNEEHLGCYDMALELGVSHTTLYKFLKGNHKLKMCSLYKISDYLKEHNNKDYLENKKLELNNYKKAYEQEYYHNTLMRKLLSEIKTACRIQSYNLIPYGAKELQTLILDLIEQTEV